MTWGEEARVKSAPKFESWITFSVSRRSRVRVFFNCTTPVLDSVVLCVLFLICVCEGLCVCVVAVLAVVLLRCYVVVSQDSVYMRDVRYFHRFGDMYVLRDEEIREATVAQLEVFMPTHTHTHTLTHTSVFR